VEFEKVRALRLKLMDVMSKGKWKVYSAFTLNAIERAPAFLTESITLGSRHLCNLKASRVV